MYVEHRVYPTTPSVCPECGRCQHCGRPYPSPHPYRVYPIWSGSPAGGIGSTSATNNAEASGTATFRIAPADLES